METGKRNGTEYDCSDMDEYVIIMMFLSTIFSIDIGC